MTVQPGAGCGVMVSLQADARRIAAWREKPPFSIFASGNMIQEPESGTLGLKACFLLGV